VRVVKVFISHSTSRDEYGRWVREALCQGLRDRGYEVLVDADGLRSGDEWRPRLYCWLRECRAAVVLLNRAALESDWVRREADILMWRRSFNGSLLVLPVLVGDVTAEDVREAGFGDLSEVQMTHQVPTTASLKLSPSEAALEILDRFPDLPRHEDDDLVSRWVEDIAAQFAQVWTVDRLPRVGAALGLPERDLSSLVPQSDVSCGFLAAQMLHTHEATRLDKALREISRHMDGSALDHLVHLVLPVWIDPTSARWILPPGWGRDRHAVVLNVQNPETGAYYLGRAFCMDGSRYCCLTVGTGPCGEEDPETELRNACERAIRSVFGMTSRHALEDAPEQADCHTYLILDAEHCTLEQAAKVVDWLHEKLPWLHVLVIPPQRLEERDDRPGGLADILLLTPPFGADDERLAIRVGRGMLLDWSAARPGGVPWARR